MYCTKPPSGTPRYIYAAIHRDFGMRQQTLYGTWADAPNFCFVFCPESLEYWEPYQIRTLRNFLSEERDRPFVKGQIIRLENILENVNVDGCTFLYGNF